MRLPGRGTPREMSAGYLVQMRRKEHLSRAPK